MPFCVYFQGVHGLLISLMNSMFRVIICIVQIIVSPFHYFFNTVTLSDLSFVIVLFFQQVFLDHLLYVSFCGRFRGYTALCPWSFVARDGRGNSPEAVLDGRGRQTVLLGYKERGLDHQNLSVKPWSGLYFLIGKRHIVNCSEVFCCLLFCF